MLPCNNAKGVEPMTSTPQDETLFWQLPTPVLLEQIGSSPSGLTNTEAAARLGPFGPNQVHATKKGAVLLQYLSRFRNPLVIILLVASCILALTGDLTGFFIISTIILVSVTLDFIQEHRAGEAAERLRQSVAVRVQALRDGKPSDVALEALVPGDVVLLVAGDLIPGDGRVLEAKDFFLNQALLTGEPYPVEKSPAELPEEKDLLSAGNAVLMGTSVISGSAKILVCQQDHILRLGKLRIVSLQRRPPPRLSTAPIASAS